MLLASSTVMVPSLPTLSHCFSNDITDCGIAIGGNGGNLRDFTGFLSLFLLSFGQLGDSGFYSLINTAFEHHRIGTSGDIL